MSCANTTTTAAPAPAVSMVAPWEKHLTIAGREPHSLFERGLAQAEYDHRTRVEELVSMQDKLAQLDKLLPELNARGIMLQNRMLRIYCNGVVGIGSIGTPDDAAYAALLAIGFTEVFRNPYYPGSSTDTVHLLYGEKLMIGMEVSRATAQREKVVAA